MSDDDSFPGSGDAFDRELELAEEMAETLERSSRTFSRTLVSGMRAALMEGRRLDSIMKRAAMSISAAAFRSAMRPIVGALTGGAEGLVGGLVTGLTGSAVKTAANLLPFADGGVIGAPTAFPLPGGKTGIMGEAGREAVLPLSRGPDGRLGVAVEGGTQAVPTVHVTINTPDVDGFRRSEAQVTAMLARAVGRGRRGL